MTYHFGCMTSEQPCELIEFPLFQNPHPKCVRAFSFSKQVITSYNFAMAEVKHTA